MAGDSGEKTEKPTPQRLKKARGEGQIPRTQDLAAWTTVLAATWLLPVAVTAGGQQIAQMFGRIGELAGAGPEELIGFFGDAVARGTLVAAPLVLVAMVLGVGTTIAQIGWAPKKLKMDFKKLDVFKGIKGMFGMRLAWESGKNTFKLVLVLGLGIAPVSRIYEALVASGSGMNVPAMAGLIAAETVGYLRTVAIAGLVLAAADYWQNKRQVDKQIKMSKQEIKEENKQQEGDPQLKGQIRARQYAMSRNRMMAEVPKADVVLVNPTHLAVALRYDPAVGAPVVLAKGAGPIADRIRELAGESRIPIVRDVPLARTVYRVVDVGQQIPAELYEAIARVLAFVYSLRSRGRAAGTHDTPFGAVHEDLADMAKAPPRRRQPAA